MAKVVIPVTADTSEAEKNVESFVKNSEKTVEIEPKFDLVEDSVIDKQIQEVERKIQQANDTGPKYDLVGEVTKYDRQIEYLGLKVEDLKTKLAQLGAGDLEGDYFKVSAELERTNNQLDSLKQKREEESAELREQIRLEQQKGTEIEKNTNKQKNQNTHTQQHGLHLKDIIKKVTRWGLALVGIRSAYTFIRGAIGQVASRNEEVNAKLEQMRNVLYNALTPLIQTIVNFLMKAMVYINYITYALFKKNIFDFSKATETSKKNMASTAKSAGSTAKSLKQASKQLAGFDEMNVLSDNRSSGGGGTSGVGGVGGLDTKNMFEGLENIEIPKWVQQMTSFIKGIIDWFNKLNPVAKASLGLLAGGLLIGSKLLGGGGLISLLTGGKGGLTTAGKILPILGKTVLAVGTLEGTYWLATEAMKAWGIETQTTGDIVTDLVNVIDGFIKKRKEEKETTEAITANMNKDLPTYDKWRLQIIKNVKAGKELTNAEDNQIRAMEQRIVSLGKLKKPTEEQKKQLQQLKNYYGDLYREGALNNTQMEIYKVLTDKTIGSEKERSAMVEELMKKEDAERIAKEKNISVTEALNQTEYTGVVYMDEKGNTLDDLAKKYGLNKEQVEKLKTAIDKANDSSLSAGEQNRILSETMRKLKEDTGLANVKINDIKKSISNMKSKKITVEVDQKTNIITNIMTKGKDILRKQLKAMGKTDAELKEMGLRKGGIIQFASGGIINRPGRGVPLARGGEAGREGVIPLTDSQQMMLLGEAIGKYITINANITNTMNGRVLSRELQKIQNEENFASNRW